MISPVFRFYLPHLLWFLFGCSVLWKVGRLKPDPVADQIRVIIDGPGEVGRITRQEIEQVFRGKEAGEIVPEGSAMVSDSGNGFVLTIPEVGTFVAVVRQVWNMLDNWPRKKSALFEEEGLNDQQIIFINRSRSSILPNNNENS
ncbi:MAG: hypothetical protein LUQ50_05600 [Methanospirillum sp.]|uniref:hypothetical protein n=1 Tax=Methanospirillum sp. TaxID=45200 RepID=UPI0023748F20|nr:hypothetical protein [Methanospirillum sp.]MDD1728526.1 hypothetical protein [Methanospirillum sp.]